MVLPRPPGVAGTGAVDQPPGQGVVGEEPFDPGSESGRMPGRHDGRRLVGDRMVDVAARRHDRRHRRDRGGYGNPQARDAVAVHDDLREGYISEGHARRVYPHAAAAGSEPLGPTGASGCA